MDILVIVNQLIQLFIMMGLGYFMCKVGHLDRHTNQKMTKVVLNVTNPCLIISSVLSQTGERKLGLVALTFAVAFGYYILMPFFGYLIARLLRTPKNQRGLYTFMSIFENTGFMGIPLIGAIFGSEGLLYTAIIIIVFNLAIFGYGPILLAMDGDKEGKSSFKDLISPGFIMSCMAIVIYIFDIHLPSLLSGVITSLGNVTSPMAMILTGSALALMDIREVFTDLRIYPFIAVRHMIFPLLIYPIFALIIKDPVLLGVTFILTIMPCASNCVLFATNYGSDEKVAARGVFISTLLSVITIPILVSICLL